MDTNFSNIWCKILTGGIFKIFDAFQPDHQNLTCKIVSAFTSFGKKAVSICQVFPLLAIRSCHGFSFWCSLFLLLFLTSIADDHCRFYLDMSTYQIRIYMGYTDNSIFFDSSNLQGLMVLFFALYNHWHFLIRFGSNCITPWDKQLTLCLSSCSVCTMLWHTWLWFYW